MMTSAERALLLTASKIMHRQMGQVVKAHAEKGFKNEELIQDHNDLGRLIRLFRLEHEQVVKQQNEGPQAVSPNGPPQSGAPTDMSQKNGPAGGDRQAQLACEAGNSEGIR